MEAIGSLKVGSGSGTDVVGAWVTAAGLVTSLAKEAWEPDVERGSFEEAWLQAWLSF